jgi:hypothetical protein
MAGRANTGFFLKVHKEAAWVTVMVIIWRKVCTNFLQEIMINKFVQI